MTFFPFFSCLLFSLWPVGRTVAHLILRQLICAAYSDSVGALLEPVLAYVPFTHLSVRRWRKKPTTFMPTAQLEWTCEWGDFVTSFPLFKAHSLVGWPFSGLLCKIWRQWQPFAASTSPHRVWPALQCSLSGISFLLFFLYQMSDFAQIFTHSVGGGC